MRSKPFFNATISAVAADDGVLGTLERNAELGIMFLGLNRFAVFGSATFQE